MGISILSATGYYHTYTDEARSSSRVFVVWYYFYLQTSSTYSPSFTKLSTSTLLGPVWYGTFPLHQFVLW